MSNVPIEEIMLPQGWSAQYHPQYQKHYFVNAKTGKSQWQEPRGSKRLGSNDVGNAKHSHSHKKEALGVIGAIAGGAFLEHEFKKRNGNSFWAPLGNRGHRA